MKNQNFSKRKRSDTVTCGMCGKVGHNRRTCGKVLTPPQRLAQFTHTTMLTVNGSGEDGDVSQWGSFVEKLEHFNISKQTHTTEKPLGRLEGVEEVLIESEEKYSTEELKTLWALKGVELENSEGSITNLLAVADVLENFIAETEPTPGADVGAWRDLMRTLPPEVVQILVENFKPAIPISLSNCPSVSHEALKVVEKDESLSRQNVRGWMFSKFTVAPEVIVQALAEPEFSHAHISLSKLKGLPADTVDKLIKTGNLKTLEHLTVNSTLTPEQVEKIYHTVNLIGNELDEDGNEEQREHLMNTYARIATHPQTPSHVLEESMGRGELISNATFRRGVLSQQKLPREIFKRQREKFEQKLQKLEKGMESVLENNNNSLMEQCEQSTHRYKINTTLSVVDDFNTYGFGSDTEMRKCAIRKISKIVGLHDTPEVFKKELSDDHFGVKLETAGWGESEAVEVEKTAKALKEAPFAAEELNVIHVWLEKVDNVNVKHKLLIGLLMNPHTSNDVKRKVNSTYNNSENSHNFHEQVLKKYAHYTTHTSHTKLSGDVKSGTEGK